MKVGFFSAKHEYNMKLNARETSSKGASHDTANRGLEGIRGLEVIKIMILF